MIDKLVSKIQKLNAPIVVGLDPNLAFVPEHIKKQFEGMQDPMEAAAESIFLFNKGIVDAVCGKAADCHV